MSKRIPILIVEDEEHIRNILDYNLRLDGFEVHMAGDGATGLELANKHKFQVILLDWMMPKMNGLEVLSELKHTRKTEHILVFMLTAKGAIGDMDRAYDIGVDGYITKPFDAKLLGSTIRKKLEECSKVKSK
ncbi:MAG: response regulator transcription factor [Planctomycetota bacterium]|jgi:two-component system alkaline phosphatase synthesis response regulator PhoP